jgi:8-oxo-dGTP pyrophosphatase MutT (NUDIX family)
MAYDDKYRLSSHAVIFNEQNDVLLLKASYGNCTWGLPGGALDKAETIHEALVRECKEELNCLIEIEYLSGVYYHCAHESQAFIFKCRIASDCEISLSDEHTEYKYVPLDELSLIQRQRVVECLNYNGVVKSDKF